MGGVVGAYYTYLGYEQAIYTQEKNNSDDFHI